MTGIFKLLSIVLFCGVLAGCGNSRPDTSSESATVAEVTLAKLKLRDLEGRELDLSALTGKRVFVNFWATWCKPCLAEMPSIDHATELLADKNVIFIAASDEKLERIENFKQKSGYRFDILSTGADLSTLGVFALPATFIFDEQGELVYKEAGAREWDSEESLELIMKRQNL